MATLLSVGDPLSRGGVGPDGLLSAIAEVNHWMCSPLLCCRFHDGGFIVRGLVHPAAYHVRLHLFRGEGLQEILEPVFSQVADGDIGPLQPLRRLATSD